MVYHWQSHSIKLCGVDDMVLLPRPTEDAIVDNLKKRFLDDYIYTSIGPVLISVNPFKQMPYFGEKEIEQYQGAALYENPPHIYGLTDQMFRNLLIDTESQCVIISGESGAGKTVAARYIMSYIARVSGGSSRVQHVKDVVLKSNPLLEAFGNAKTIRNNNSSRFGKYVEIVFDAAGQPVGGRISNFLLEKSRVPNLSVGERNFHIFYQICKGAHSDLKNDLGIVGVQSFQYLCSGSTFSVEGLNDAKEFKETTAALEVMGFSDAEQRGIWNIVVTVLHLGNICFNEQGNYACVSDSTALDWPAYLMGVDKSQLESKLTSRLFESKWGKNEDSINVTLNVEQAVYTRDALAKGIYSKLFDHLVQRVNAAMFTDSGGNNIGILDIYGFEILEKNGFEQLCINFVNEKLQQIFIQLTLKSEQEEYVAENIAWSPIDYFNNQIVCELLEGRQPPGVFLVLDDVCATMHAVADGADQDLQKKLNGSSGTHKHYSSIAEGFVIKHYAGVVSYSVNGFCDRNRDVFFPDLVQLLQSSTSQFVRNMFPEPALKTRPTTAGNKIRSQAGELVAKLMKCSPHYVRCIKPNESKSAREWDELRVKHQVEYLGLRENISVRRAGFAYRRPFKKFLQRYAILTKESWPAWRGGEKDGVRHIFSAAGFKEAHEFQLGKTKVFIKTPESLFHLEELRDEHYNKHAIVIQRAFKRYFARKQQNTQRVEAAALVHGKKERRRMSIYRHFVGDYLGISSQPELQILVGKRERIIFAIPITKYDRRFKPSSRDLILTSRSLLLVSVEPNAGGSGNQFIVKRNIPFPNISHLTLSCLQDDFVVLHVLHDYDSLLEIPLKIEFLYALHKRFFSQVGRQLSITFSNSIEFSVKKSGLGGGGKRQVIFVPTITGLDIAALKINGTTLTVGIGAGLPSDATLPAQRTQASSTSRKRSNMKHQIKATSKEPKISLPCPAPTRAAPPPPTQSPKGPVLSLPSVSVLTNGFQKFEATDHLRVNQSPKSKVPINFKNDLTNTIGRIRQMDVKHPEPTNKKNGRLPAESALQHSAYKKDVQNSDDSKTRENPQADFNKDLFNTISRIKSKGTVNDPGKQNRASAELSVSNGAPLQKPIPGGGRPRPLLRPSVNRVKAIYDYQAQDVDELNLKEGDFIELIKEHAGGWWQGRLKGKEGLFPANYVLKV